jgi:hypothetical protein
MSIAAAVLIGAVATTTVAAQSYQDREVQLQRQNLGGPRLGVTVVTGDGELWRDLESNSVGRVVSQFGWHFEYQVIPSGGGPQFVIELVPMIGGVEYGKVIPSGSLAMGIRFPNGLEFGLGPNVVITGGDDPLRSGLLMAIGKSFGYGGVSIPVNLVWVRNPDGNRFSMIFGYAIRMGRSRTP